MTNRTLVLTGKRIALAIMTEADQEFFRRWLVDNAELRSLIQDSRIPTPEDQKRWFRRVQESDRKFFSLVTMPEYILVGNAGFVAIDSFSQSAVLRITIGHPDFLSKGLGGEAIQLLVRYAFMQAGWSFLTLQVLETNTRAIRAYEKAGFTLLSKDLRDGQMILTMKLDRTTSSFA